MVKGFINAANDCSIDDVTDNQDDIIDREEPGEENGHGVVIDGIDG